MELFNGRQFQKIEIEVFWIYCVQFFVYFFILQMDIDYIYQRDLEG